MKKSYLLLIIIISLTSCMANIAGGISLTPSGPMESRSYDYPNISKLKIENCITLYLTHGTTQSVTVQTNSNIFDYLDINNSNDRLTIRFKHKVRTTNVNVEVHITTPDLTQLDLHGASYAQFKNPYIASSFKLDVSGASKCEANLETTNLEIECSGASKTTLTGKNQTIESEVNGASKLEIKESESQSLKVSGSGASSINLSGSTTNFEVDLSGASSCKGYDLVSQTAKTTISGASNLQVNATDNLSLGASGASSIRYAGNPRITKLDISGASSAKSK